MKIILIHGMILPAGLNFYLLERHLNQNGYNDIHKLSYDSLSMSLDKAYMYCYQQIIHILAEDLFEPIILIGYSFGGIIAYRLLDTYLNTKLAIFVASPLKSCNYLDNMPTFLKRTVEYFEIPAVTDLCDRKFKEIEPPEIPYYTITAGLVWNKEFDGKVYKKDAVIEEERNIHIGYSSHFMLTIDRRCFREITRIIEKEIKKE